MSFSTGILKKNSCERYEIEREGDLSNIELTSGNVCELLIDGRWITGRIEYDHGIKNYYFLGSDFKMILTNGLKVRINN